MSEKIIDMEYAEKIFSIINNAESIISEYYFRFQGMGFPLENKIQKSLDGIHTAQTILSCEIANSKNRKKKS
jgi:hypothetical protein